MNRPDVPVAERSKVKGNVLKAIKKSGQGACDVHGVVVHRLKVGWAVAFEKNGKRTWVEEPEPPVQCPLCEAE